MFGDKTGQFERRNRGITTPDRSEEIEALIINEKDQERRGLLIILNALNNSITANTEMTAAIGQTVEAHLVEYRAHTTENAKLLNQGKGMWRTSATIMSLATVIVVLLEAMGMYLWHDLTDTTKLQGVAIAKLRETAADHDKRLELLEFKAK